MRENNNDRIFVEFFVDKKYLYDNSDNLNYDKKNKDINDDKDKDNENEDINDKDNDNNDNNDPIFDIFNKLKISKVFDKSRFFLYLKMYLKTDFLFKYLFEENIENIINNFLHFKLIINSDINTKIFISSILDILIDYSNKNKNENMKKLFLWVKTIITIPLQIIKYDLIDNNKKDINDFIFKLYKDFEEIIKKLKEIYNSEKFFEELKNVFIMKIKE